jgi:hypothetical protein
MFEGFQKFVPKITNQLNLTQALQASQVCYLARKAIADNFPTLSDHINVDSYQNKVIKITCYSSVISSELHYKKAEIINQINAKLPSKLVDDLLIV